VRRRYSNEPVVSAEDVDAILVLGEMAILQRMQMAALQCKWQYLNENGKTLMSHSTIQSVCGHLLTTEHTVLS
jgi:hypothetical protein